MDTMTRNARLNASARKGTLGKLALWSLVPLVLLAVTAADHRTMEAAGPGVDHEDALQTFTRDVFWIQGVTLRNPTADTPADAPLFNVAGVALGETWEQWQGASARSTVITTVGPHPQTLALIRLSGLIPNGVYSMFYGTLDPDSEHPGCPGVERTLPLTSVAPNQQPDASSFVADASGNAFYIGRVDGDPLSALQMFFSVVYHLDGGTYDPYPNRGEFLTHDREDTPCRSSFGEDAMRQLLILQKV